MTELSFLTEILNGLAQVLAHPLFYVALLLVGLQYRRQNSMERRMFGVRCSSLTDQVLRSFLYGAGGGLLATVLMTVIGVVLSPGDMAYVWVVALVLALVNVRYTCFAYAGGLLSFVSLVLNALPTLTSGPDWLLGVYDDLKQLHVPDLMALVAILHLVEGILVRLNGAQAAMPVFVPGKRGRLIGGFILQKFWVIPMAAFVVTGVPDSVLHTPSWWPLMSLGGLGLGAGLQIVPVPAILGYSGAALTKTPQQTSTHTARWLVAYSIVLLCLAIGSSYFSPLAWVAALFCPIAHELLILWEMRGEQSGHPIYVKPLQGLKILSILPKSPALEMGLLPGETILKVNGTPVNTPYDLHFALNQNPAYAKLELLTPEGEVRFANTAIYTGDHHMLGVILVPDDNARQFVRLGTASPWAWLWEKLGGGRKRAHATYHEQS
ncbi:PDZ domain-containing protein [Tumebacillus sp. ITR2]|uniref:PDZ domain-containing protein n=1 Tax=Tumebacillus amylolyticus TaxID=2801339 RepID=A0ABS1J9M4_9BACL|nr:PDZ domain-containing protein [Tumebacillus amylolyticus]MBL0386977.1 PDZ domain-containing protein [Tumebacillus amylolyticus]